MRRRVDWPILFGREPPVPTVADRAPSGSVARLLSAFDVLAAVDDRDAIVRRAIELARDDIGLARAGIFLLDREHDLMLGSWGMNLAGEVVDEHHLMYALSETDREAFRRSEQLTAQFTVFENCPIVQHQGGETRVAGRGLGRLHAHPVDAGAHRDAVQRRRADGRAGRRAQANPRGDPVRAAGDAAGSDTRRARHARPAPRAIGGAPAGQRRGRAVARRPSLGGKQIADRLDISLSRLARVFKAEMGMSLVEYRNRLRLDRFGALLENGRNNLLEAALDAGFGSYAQFHRVFRALRHAAPREYLRRQN